jgi:hypothetical protein
MDLDDLTAPTEASSGTHPAMTALSAFSSVSRRDASAASSSGPSREAADDLLTDLERDPALARERLREAADDQAGDARPSASPRSQCWGFFRMTSRAPNCMMGQRTRADAVQP